MGVGVGICVFLLLAGDAIENNVKVERGTSRGVIGPRVVEREVPAAIRHRRHRIHGFAPLGMCKLRRFWWRGWHTPGVFLFENRTRQHAL